MDIFATLVQTSKKLGISAFAYLRDRLSGSLEMPSLARSILQLCDGNFSGFLASEGAPFHNATPDVDTLFSIGRSAGQNCMRGGPATAALSSIAVHF